jgi:hypothetical protein
LGSFWNYIFEISVKIQKYGSFDTYIGLIWEKKFLTLYSESRTFLAPKKPLSQETAQNKEKRIL